MHAKKTLVILCSLLISFNSYAEWTQTINSESGDVYYVDFDSIKIKGNVYYWGMVDYLKPDEWGDMSSKSLYELDCNVPQKERKLAISFYTQPMGKGSPSTEINTTQEWIYGVPNTIGMGLIEQICDHANQ